MQHNAVPGMTKAPEVAPLLGILPLNLFSYPYNSESLLVLLSKNHPCALAAYLAGGQPTLRVNAVLKALAEL